MTESSEYELQNFTPPVNTYIVEMCIYVYYWILLDNNLFYSYSNCRI